MPVGNKLTFPTESTQAYFVLLDAHLWQVKLPGSLAHACHSGPVSSAQVPSDGLPDLWGEVGVVRHL